MKKILGVLVLAGMLAVPAMASAADKLPKGFIAVSESRMNWADAKAWCEKQGGRLPLINGAASQSWDQIANPKTALIDGFGQVSTGQNAADWTTPWPSGLPDADYWTGTEYADGPGGSWVVDAGDGKVNVVFDPQSLDFRVVCVP
jgi:hypothetical protein